MGLDIAVYSKVFQVSDLPYVGEEIDWDKVDDTDGIVVVKNRLCDDLAADLAEGIYGSQKSWRFRAGSFSGHKAFKDFLSVTFIGVSADKIWADPEQYAAAPFVQLVNFSDCEGVIGATVSKKLYADFVVNEERFLTATSMPGDLNEWRRNCYSNWKRAFELAKDDGCIAIGKKTSVDQAIDLGLTKLLEGRSGVQLGFLMLDEVFNWHEI